MQANLGKYKKMSVRQLKSFLHEKNIDCTDCLEKSDLLRKIEYHGLHYEEKTVGSNAGQTRPTPSQQPSSAVADADEFAGRL